MAFESASGTSRRGFFKQAAGAAAVVAGAGAGAGAFAGSAAAAEPRTYTAGRFALDIDGDTVGRGAGMDGGGLELNVVDDPPGPDNIQRKHVANIRWSPCTVQVGSGMGVGMYKWIKASFDEGY